MKYESLINLQFKKLSSTTTIPSYQTSGAAGMDLHADLGGTDKHYIIYPGERKLIPSGFALAIPQGYEIQIRSRSGLAKKQGLTVLNSPGTIDSDYRGEIGALLINHSEEKIVIQHGDRIAQMVLCPVFQAQIEVVEELTETDRGAGGFGSTGVQKSG